MRAIAIISGKGGVGKTTSAINLGIALASLGKSITIIDANVSTPNLSLSLGAPLIPLGLQHALLKKELIEKAIYRHHSGIKIIPSSLAFSEKTDISNLPEIVKEIKKISDIVLIDCAAGINNEMIYAVKAADECLLLTNPEMPALASALKALKTVKQLNKKITGICLLYTSPSPRDLSTSRMPSSA